jgi:TrwC relaxase
MHSALSTDIPRGMLSIGKLGKGQEHYYLDKVAEGAEDYYSGEGEVAGEWVGDAAEDLGLWRGRGRAARSDTDRPQSC